MKTTDFKNINRKEYDNAAITYLLNQGFVREDIYCHYCGKEFKVVNIKLSDDNQLNVRCSPYCNGYTIAKKV